MSQVDRREFMKKSGAAGAAVAAAGGVSWSGSSAEAHPGHRKPDESIPPHRVQIVYGMHAYTDKLSVEAGEMVKFHTSSTVPYQLSVCRLGPFVDDTSADEVLHEFPPSEAKFQPIHPGSYGYVENGLDEDMPLEALSIECWVRPYLSKDPACILTQFDLPRAAGFALFMNKEYSLSLYIGDGKVFKQKNLHTTAPNVLKRNKWQHVVATWDGKTKTIWVDGRRIATWPSTATLRPGPSPIRLGARGDYGEAHRLLDGDIAMPVIYNRALSEPEIEERYEEQGLKTATGKDVLACWPLTEERGDRFADASGHGHDGRIINEGTWMIGGPSYDASDVPRWGDYDPNTDPTRGHGLRFATDDLYDCRWKATHKFRIPKSAKSGFYVARYRYKLNGTDRIYHELFIVRRPKSSKKKPPVLLLAATNTYRAYTYRPFAEIPPGLKYNDWEIANSPGNPPAYSFYGGHKAGHVTYRLGLRMPSPNSGPYVNSMTGGSEHNYSHLARADRLTEVWLAENGYDYDVISDYDLDQNPEILKGYEVFIINGHSEYWSIPAYNGVKRYLDEDKGQLIVMSGNTMFWRVSFDQDAKTLECRKIDAPGNPINPKLRGESYHSEDGLQGGLMRDCGYPAWELLGLECSGWDGDVSAMGPFVAENTDHFLYHKPEETGLKDGDKFGQAPDGEFPVAGGHEFDVRVSTLNKLQQGPVPDGATKPVEPAGIDYLGYSIHRWKPHAFICDYYTRKVKTDGNLGGEMILWDRPEGGTVFHAGVIAGGWVLSVDPKFQAMMRNVMSHFGIERNAKK